MSDSASSLTSTIARQYDLFQASLEFLQKDRKFLNYGYTVSGKETYEERQQQLCLEVFQSAEIGQGSAVFSRWERRYVARGRQPLQPGIRVESLCATEG